MKLVYVMNPYEAEGYLFRAPRLIARLFCAVANRRFHRSYDYSVWPEGDPI